MSGTLDAILVVCAVVGALGYLLYYYSRKRGSDLGCDRCANRKRPRHVQITTPGKK